MEAEIKPYKELSTTIMKSISFVNWVDSQPDSFRRHNKEWVENVLKTALDALTEILIHYSDKEDQWSELISQVFNKQTLDGIRKYRNLLY